MSRFNYSEEELNVNKVLKMNQDLSHSLVDDKVKEDLRKQADNNIESSLNLLNSLGKNKEVIKLTVDIGQQGADRELEHRPVLEEWDAILEQANEYESNPVILEDIMTEEEIESAFQELDEINRTFSRKTGIINSTDLSFLAIATGLQVAKSLVFPYVSGKFGYGDSIDKSKRLDHNDKSIENAHKNANDSFKNKQEKKYGKGYWINLLYQTPPYDITKGSVDLGINMGGAYHRLYTLGHDPILGWIFGTMNILTDVITLNNFQSYRVVRKPKMTITSEVVPMWRMVQESYEVIKDHKLNLPAAIFAQAQHLKSDEYTKLGLPVPLLATINEDFSSKLYKSHYDALCLARDTKIVSASFVVSKVFDTIISLVHGLFRNENEPKELYEVRTRKILLISNAIASSSTIINASITQNPKNLDIGSLLNTITRLFSDVRFVARIKREYIEGEIANKLKIELQEVDRMFEEI
ncbi:hypothetical protein GMC23_13195 [Turicibacter sanguinis]|nr:hypothetical protein [Turicibacter sanguinis]MTO27894.1 hypothetical protein [Turicibacter sanguinis]MTO90809.1 hypothetical protein [Turicibacter sanguinis]MTP71069.1 hypothetical protein [Turicibacter sanguinis]MTQ02616.1 hypothetical protein [Turicibacter sanguinis]